jgi:hypothetical protein
VNCRLLIPDCRLIGDRRITALAVAVLTLSACGQSERPVLEQFFGASRLRDTTALQAVSTVIFEPLQQGIVRTFRITGVSAERVDGQITTKDVTVDAAVLLPDGRTVQKVLVVTLQHARDDESRRWMVAGVRDAGSAPSAPRS